LSGVGPAVNWREQKHSSPPIYNGSFGLRFPWVAARNPTMPPKWSAHFATLRDGAYDGLRCDTHGNVWAATSGGVHCCAPDGTHIGTIPIPELVSNVCFGGRKRNRLFITAQTSLYAI
jgi:sugar lactone lactonase YvrE